MTGRRTFGPDELGADRADELDDAAAAAFWLESSIDDAPVRPTGGFGDRVMAALADEPAPTQTGFLAPLRRLGVVGGFAASVRQAWSAAVGGGRPVLARASALAYVLAIVIAGTSLAGAATFVLAGALGVLGPSATQSAPPASPSPTIVPSVTDLPSAESPPPTAGESEDPSESDASDDHGGIGEPDATDGHDGDGSGTDGSIGSDSEDDGWTPGPASTSGSGSDDHSDSSSWYETATARPSGTPRPSGSPTPTETPD
jgi:hypothetical protein